jgi:hypothetical protein
MVPMSWTSHKPFVSYQTHNPFMALSRDWYDSIGMLFEASDVRDKEALTVLSSEGGLVS